MVRAKNLSTVSKHSRQSTKVSKRRHVNINTIAETMIELSKKVRRRQARIIFGVDKIVQFANTPIFKITSDGGDVVMVHYCREYVDVKYVDAPGFPKRSMTKSKYAYDIDRVDNAKQRMTANGTNQVMVHWKPIQFLLSDILPTAIVSVTFRYRGTTICFPDFPPPTTDVVDAPIGTIIVNMTIVDLINIRESFRKH